jgi:hypothetical protein
MLAVKDRSSAIAAGGVQQPSAVIGAEIIQNGCFLETRLRALDTEATVEV